MPMLTLKASWTTVSHLLPPPAIPAIPLIFPIFPPSSCSPDAAGNTSSATAVCNIQLTGTIQASFHAFVQPAVTFVPIIITKPHRHWNLPGQGFVGLFLCCKEPAGALIIYCRVSPFSLGEVAVLFIAPCSNWIPLACVYWYLSHRPPVAFKHLIGNDSAAKSCGEVICYTGVIVNRHQKLPSRA